jgi:type IV secretion system protein VirB10
MNTIDAATASPPPSSEPGGNRDIPKLQTKKKTNNLRRLAIAGVILLMVVFLAIGIALFMERLKQRSLQQKAEKAKQQPVAMAEASGPLDLEAAKKRIKADEMANQPPVPATEQLPPPSGAIDVVPNGGAENIASGNVGGARGNARSVSSSSGPAGSGGAVQGADTQYQQTSQVETPVQRRLSGDVLVSTGSERAVDSRNAQVVPPLPGALAARPDAGRTELQDQLRPTQLDAVSASRHPNLDLMLLAGASIPCGQKTLINSTNPGMASCVISRDVYSVNGATLLVERGSEVIGERLQPLQLGQEMMPVKWNRIVTTKGVVIDINSLATDSLGASGLPVYVDNHFGQRFGAAIMLSLITDAGQAAANKASNADGTIRLATTANAGQDLSTRALDKTINIPPTGYSLQGEAINIFLARDAYFGGVYELARY